MRKNQKMDLKKGDVIKCHDQDEMSKVLRQLTVERYDAVVDEANLTITVRGRFGKNGERESVQ